MLQQAVLVTLLTLSPSPQSAPGWTEPDVAVYVHVHSWRDVLTCNWRLTEPGTRTAERTLHAALSELNVCHEIAGCGWTVSTHFMDLDVHPRPGEVRGWWGVIPFSIRGEGRLEFPELRVVGRSAGPEGPRTADLTLRPSVEVVRLGNRRALLYALQGYLTVRGTGGARRVGIRLRVLIDPIDPLESVLNVGGPVVDLRRASVTLIPDGLTLSAQLLERLPEGSSAYALARIESPGGTLALSTRKHREVRRERNEVVIVTHTERPSGKLSGLPLRPLRIRLELHDDEGRIVGAYEYTIRVGPAVIHPFGSRYLIVSIEGGGTGSPGVTVAGWRAIEGDGERPETVLLWTAYHDDPGGRRTFTLLLRLAARLPWTPPDPATLLDGLLGTSTTLLTLALNRLLGVPPEALYGWRSVPRLPPRYALAGLAACLTALATRHYLGPLTYATLGVFVPEGFLTGVPLALWGLRLIAAGTGLPLPAVGALGWLVQWIFDENEEPDVVPPHYWCLPRTVLSRSPPWYLGRALADLDALLEYLATGAILVSLPLPLAQLAWTLLWAPTGLTDLPIILLALAQTALTDPGSLVPTACSLLPLLPLLAPPPAWLTIPAGLPALLAHAGSVLLSTRLLTAEPTTTVRVTLTVTFDRPGPDDPTRSLSDSRITKGTLGLGLRRSPLTPRRPSSPRSCCQFPARPVSTP
ncbi:MAG: hypothetical protein ACXQTC_04325 [Methanopyraceae archaeon]